MRGEERGKEGKGEIEGRREAGEGRKADQLIDRWGFIDSWIHAYMAAFLNSFLYAFLAHKESKQTDRQIDRQTDRQTSRGTEMTDTGHERPSMSG
mmetsp:Transcript_15853/g.32190  ORF Transcript_15853/g.32190 Transcript_15853/m.32190 type:complete len:95 (-) Transcript_15853:206-490(-)